MNSSAWSSGSSSRSGSSQHQTSQHNFDIGSKSQLTNLYNQKVVHAERVERPLNGSSFKLYPYSHTGTRLTTADGSKWLVHKGGNYGSSGGDTVITGAKHMGPKWETMPGTAHSVQQSTVGDFVQAGGTDYTRIKKNCHKASKEMGKLP